MKRTYNFFVKTIYAGSTVSEKVDIEFSEDLTEQEIEQIVAEMWCEWREVQCEGGFELVE